MKRFTETTKWTDPWFRRLSAQAKLVWFYALDHCDNIGLVELDPEFISMDCRIKCNASHITELGDRVQEIGENKFFIPKFILFQYGKLSNACIPHKKVLEAIESHGLILINDRYSYPTARVSDRVSDRVSHTLKTVQDSTEKEEEQDSTEKEGEKAAFTHTGYTEAFETFWKAYPNKVGKGSAAKAFEKVKHIDLAILLDAITKQLETEQWQDPRYIPHPTTWLNGRRWEDEVEPVKKKHQLMFT